MAAKGWITIRDLVDIGKQSVADVIKSFFEEHDLCPKCEGRGFIVNDEKISYNPGVSSVKYQGYEALEKMYKDGNLNGEVIRKILETDVHGRTQCKKCEGFGFIKKSRKKKNEKAS